VEPGRLLVRITAVVGWGARVDRRHWVLLLAALACIAGLVLWIGEIDLGMEETIAPPPASPASVPASR